MWAYKAILSALASLLALSAMASDQPVAPALPALPIASPVQDAPRFLLRPEAQVRRFDPVSGWTSRYDPTTGTRVLEGQTTALTQNSQFGLNWTLDGQPPSLEYRFSRNGVMRFRGSRHGVKAVVNWDF